MELGETFNVVTQQRSNRTVEERVGQPLDPVHIIFCPQFPRSFFGKLIGMLNLGEAFPKPEMPTIFPIRSLGKGGMFLIVGARAKGDLVNDSRNLLGGSFRKKEVAAFIIEFLLGDGRSR